MPALGSDTDVPGCVRPTGVGNAGVLSGIRCKPYGSSFTSGAFIWGAPKKDVAVEGMPKLVVLVLKDGVVMPNELEKLGVGAPKLKPPEPNPVPVVLGAAKPNPVVGAKLVDELNPDDVPKLGAVPDDMKEVVGKDDVPNPPVPNPPPEGAKEFPKPEPDVPKDGAEVLLKENGAVELPNIFEPVVAPNEPNPPPEEAPNGLVPKLVAGVELNEPKPEPKEGVVVGVVPKELPKELPKGEAVVLPNELVLLPNENGLLLADEPNIPPEPIAPPVLEPKAELEVLPKGLAAGAPKLPVEPKGDDDGAGAPPWCSQRSSSKLLLA